MRGGVPHRNSWNSQLIVTVGDENLSALKHPWAIATVEAVISFLERINGRGSGSRPTYLATCNRVLLASLS